MEPIQYLTIGEVELIAHRLATELLELNEPIPPFSTRYPDVLERCIFSPQQTFDKKDVYPNLYSKAAVLFYLMIKNHPFKNGNKRVAVTTLYLFLRKNSHTIEVDPGELFRLTFHVATSNARLKDQTLKTIEEFIKKYSTKL